MCFLRILGLRALVLLSVFLVYCTRRLRKKGCITSLHNIRLGIKPGSDKVAVDFPGLPAVSFLSKQEVREHSICITELALDEFIRAYWGLLMDKTRLEYT